MALQLSVDTPEATFPNAYHRIVCISIDVQARVARFLVWSYASNAARLARKRLVVPERWYAVNDGDFDNRFSAAALDALGKSPFAAAYLYLHTLTDFDGAADV